MRNEIRHMLFGLAALGAVALGPRSLAVDDVVRLAVRPSVLQEEFFEDYKERGYRPARITGYTDGGRVLYATRWVREAGPAWAAYYGLTGDEFHEKFLELRAGGFRPLDVSGYETPFGTRYATVWEKASGFEWQLDRDIDATTLRKLVDALEPEGWIPVSIESYRLDGEVRYIVVWHRVGGLWYLYFGKTREEYQTLVDDLAKEGFVPSHVDHQSFDGEDRYAAIWRPVDGRAWETRTDRGFRRLTRLLENRWREGFEMTGLTATGRDGETARFGGAWIYREPVAVDVSSSLYQQIRERLAGVPGRTGAYIADLRSGEETWIHPDQEFSTASAIKAAILYALLRHVQDTPDTLDTLISSQGQYGATTCPVPQVFTPCILFPQPNTLYSLRTLAEYMIRTSNNWATNRLIDRIGFDEINGYLGELDLDGTRVARYMTGTGAPSVAGNGGPGGDYRAGIDNVSTPRELVTLLGRIHQGSASLTSSLSSVFWEILALDANPRDDVNFKGYVPRGLSDLFGSSVWPSFVEVYNKPGQLRWSFSSWPASAEEIHETGPVHGINAEVGRLVFSDGRVVFYAFFADEQDVWRAAVDEIAEAGARVAERYRPQPPIGL